MTKRKPVIPPDPLVSVRESPAYRRGLEHQLRAPDDKDLLVSVKGTAGQR